MATDLVALQEKRNTLTAIDAQISAHNEELSKKIAALREQHEKDHSELRSTRERLAKEYSDALKAELASIVGSRGASATRSRAPRGSNKIDTEAVVAEFRKAQIEIKASDVRERAGITASSNALSVALNKLVEDGTLVKIGQGRGTKYRIK